MSSPAEFGHPRGPASEESALVHPLTTLILGVVALLFAGTAVYSYAGEEWFYLLFSVGVALWAVTMIAEYYLARYRVSDKGMAYGKTTGAKGYMYWSELTSVQYEPLTAWFRLETRSGDVARLSVMLSGLPEFAQLLLTHAPTDAIEPATLPILQATADGHPPSAWD